MESDRIANSYANLYEAGGLRQDQTCVLLVHMLEAASEPSLCC